MAKAWGLAGPGPSPLPPGGLPGGHPGRLAHGLGLSPPLPGVGGGVCREGGLRPQPALCPPPRG
ncbi:hypothetical protein ABTM83_19235, partial [Acinetobacter baumannii]